MKVKMDDDLIIIFLYNENLDLDNESNLLKKLKDIFKKIKRYNLDNFGLYSVYIYENKYYGYILEIKKIRDYSFCEILDLKVKIIHDVSFYFKCYNYSYIEDIDNIYYDNEAFYTNIKNISNIYSKIELGEIIYKTKVFNWYKLTKINKKMAID